MRAYPWTLPTAALLFAARVTGTAPVQSQSDPTAASTREMAALLRERAAEVDPLEVPYIVNDRRAELIRAQLDGPLTARDSLGRRFDYATELLNAGRIPDALAAIEDLEKRAEAVNPAAWRQHAGRLLIVKAVAYLRQGEQENCNDTHSAQSCLMPIRGQGLHHRREGSERAIRVLDRILGQEPDNLRARWLLNIAHMTLGQYPEAVPAAQLIPPSAFAAQYPLPRFPNVAAEVGLDVYGLSGGAILDDFDRDGRLDLMVSAIGFEDQLRLFHNDGRGRFQERTAAAGLTGETGGLNLLQADYDNDGRPDLYLSLGGGRNILFRNGGPQAGDGWPDLFVSGFGAMAEDVAADMLGLPTSAERGRLYRNKGDGTFADVTREAGLHRVAPGMGMNYGDLDNDGFLDLYIGTGNPDLSTLVPNLLFRNDGGRRFQDVTTAADVGHLQKGHAICFGDLDDDGDQDLFEQMGGAVFADRARSALYENPGNANAWLSLELQGVRANRSAIGARVKVAVDTGEGPRVFHRTVGSGASFGASPLRLEIGLGRAQRIRWVEILWPGSGQRQTIDGLAPGRRYLVREGDRPQGAKRSPFRLGRRRP